VESARCLHRRSQRCETEAWRLTCGPNRVDPPARNRLQAAQLDEVRLTGRHFTAVCNHPDSAEYLSRLSDGPGASRAALPGADQKSDLAVRLFETASAQKVARLRWIQVFFLPPLCSCWRRRLDGAPIVIVPLRGLGETAARIGSGNLTTPSSQTAG